MKRLEWYYPDRHMLHYSFHISLSPAFIYVNNAKCGCTTAKASINIWYAAWHGKKLTYASAGEIHERSLSPLLNPNRVGTRAEKMILEDANVFRFTLFRDPLSRLASAYSSKMTWKTRERTLVNRAAGQAEDRPVPWGDFVSLICSDDALRNSNEHWRPQTAQIAADIIPYDRICLQENLREDLLSVRNHLFPGLDIDVFDAGMHFPGNKSHSATLLTAMQPGEIAQIERAYAEDFTFYRKVLERKEGPRV